MVKITLIALILAAINSQILNDSDGSVGLADHQGTGNAAHIFDGFEGLGGAAGFLPIGGPASGPAVIPAGGIATPGASGPGVNKQNTQTKSDAGLAQLVFSGAKSSLISAPIFSNQDAFGDNTGDWGEDGWYDGCMECECPTCYE